MVRNVLIALAITVLFGSPLAMAAASELPEPVSPGSTATLARVGDACPTFSWTAARGAERYELVVYAVGESETESTEVLRRAVPGGATSWTPSLDECLERGARYGWSVRAVGEKAASEWSAPNLFEVASGPSEAEFEEALEIVRQYVAGAGVEASSDDQGSASTGVQSTAPASSGLQASDPPAPLAPAPAGDSDLMVNGSAVVTTATLAGALCSTTEVRFLDLGDGTVLDCNTDLIWLKNANCAGAKTWQAAKDWAAGLASGSCGLTDGSSAGDWRLPEIGEFCSEDAPTPSPGVCPLANASDSLVNSNFSAPAVGNAAGDGQWAADDAFVGVQSLGYWSATEFDAFVAWFVSLSNGNVDGSLKDNGAYVWPVRSGQ